VCIAIFGANTEFRVPYSQWYLFNAIPDTNHNANPTNPYTRYRCEYAVRVNTQNTAKHSET